MNFLQQTTSDKWDNSIGCFIPGKATPVKVSHTCGLISNLICFKIVNVFVYNAWQSYISRRLHCGYLLDSEYSK